MRGIRFFVVYFLEVLTIAKLDHQLNEEIRDKEIRVIGNDDIGIVNNITSIISKEEKIQLRSISIDSNDGIFFGTLTVMVDDNSKLQQLIKKLKTVKGVKDVTRQ